MKVRPDHLWRKRIQQLLHEWESARQFNLSKSQEYPLGSNKRYNSNLIAIGFERCIMDLKRMLS